MKQVSRAWAEIVGHVLKPLVHMSTGGNYRARDEAGFMSMGENYFRHVMKQVSYAWAEIIRHVMKQLVQALEH
jgi:hypothetical protein